ncbi:fungal specific transcription factor domain-containing protein [Lasiodiplodia theobromae]|uniref:Fungal specific transcription factor domain-containing protein n=1 Tax=Lasiodiplodia theobromae TaxID=45133 RepID=A0A8H7IRM6_9PEZI|nr:fungal specific transcription factor domain-containing protein [Lasiodiplodia theobromae]
MNQAWYVFGNAVQIISALGLHRKAGRKRNGAPTKNPSSDYIKDQCRKRTFWVAYIIDKYLSVVLGRPRHYHDDDIDQDFPDLVNDADMTPQGRSSSEPLEDCHVEALILHAKLARIIGQTSREVYSIAPSKTKDARVASAHRLMRELHSWRASLPPHLSTVRPATLMPSFRKQTAALKLAYSHAIMHASRPFLLGHTSGGDGSSDDDEKGDGQRGEATGIREAVEECLAAARVALQTVDAMAGDGTLFHAFWWTYYVTFCALAVVYVWEIQQSAGEDAAATAVGATDDGSLRKLFDLAERCHAHLERATAADSPNRRYSIILEELRLEARHSSSGGVGAQYDVSEQVVRPPHVTGSSTIAIPPEFGSTELEAALVQEGEMNFEPIMNPLDQWEATDWLDLDSSAFEPFLDFNGSPVYSF